MRKKTKKEEKDIESYIFKIRKLNKNNKLTEEDKIKFEKYLLMQNDILIPSIEYLNIVDCPTEYFISELIIKDKWHDIVVISNHVPNSRFKIKFSDYIEKKLREKIQEDPNIYGNYFIKLAKNIELKVMDYECVILQTKNLNLIAMFAIYYNNNLIFEIFDNYLNLKIFLETNKNNDVELNLAYIRLLELMNEDKRVDTQLILKNVDNKLLKYFNKLSII